MIELQENKEDMYLVFTVGSSRNIFYWKPKSYKFSVRNLVGLISLYFITLKVINEFNKLFI